MKASYYPGCALHGTALEYDESARAVARLLDVELVELPDWNCCGASSAHATDEALALNLAARNLTIAGTQGMDLIVPCAACYSRLKAAERKISGDGGRDSSFRVLNPLEFLFLSGLSVEAARACKTAPHGTEGRLLLWLSARQTSGCHRGKAVRASGGDGPADASLWGQSRSPGRTRQIAAAGVSSSREPIS